MQFSREKSASLLPCTALTRKGRCHSGRMGSHPWHCQLASRRTGSPPHGNSVHISDCPSLQGRKGHEQSELQWAEKMKFVKCRPAIFHWLIGYVILQWFLFTTLPSNLSGQYAFIYLFQFIACPSEAMNPSWSGSQHIKNTIKLLTKWFLKTHNMETTEIHTSINICKHG